MPGRDQPIDNRVHHFMMGREKLATGRRNFNTDDIVRRNQRRPGLGNIDLTRDRKNELIHHAVDKLRIYPKVGDRIGIVRHENDRRRRPG